MGASTESPHLCGKLYVMTRGHFLGFAALLTTAACNRSADATAVGGLQGLVGRPVPNFSVPRLGGGTGSLADYRGKAVLANLWATWCPPCRHEMPNLERLYHTYAPHGFVIVGIDQGEAASVVAAYIKKVGVTYPILLDNDQQYGPAFQAVGLPTSVFVKRDGTVSAAFDGELTYEKMRANAQAALGAK
ncbi:TlpA family protein disulfide reductase [bacterium]|nr:MAG: TlpA family protein disulfide reductase [bacterium]